MSSTTIRFTTINELFKQLNNVTGDCLIIQGVSPKDFAEIEKAREDQHRNIRLRPYKSKSKTLTIAVPSAVHEQLHCYLYCTIVIEIARMGLREAWREAGATMFRVHGHPGGDGGEGDSSGCPLPQRARGNDWPTLVIEAGHSQSMASLQQDMHWWFHASDHQVRIVLLAKMEASRGEICLEKWQEMLAPPRLGATTTRAAAAAAAPPLLAPIRTQTITITQQAGIANADLFNPTSYIVNGEALRLEFDCLFLRQPGDGEGDIIISIPQLQEYAVRVWQALVA